LCSFTTWELNNAFWLNNSQGLRQRASHRSGGIDLNLRVAAK